MVSLIGIIVGSLISTYHIVWEAESEYIVSYGGAQINTNYTWPAGDISVRGLEILKYQPVLGGIILVLLGLNLILCLASILSKKNSKDPVIHTVLPIFTLVATVVLIFFLSNMAKFQIIEANYTKSTNIISLSQMNPVYSAASKSKYLILLIVFLFYIILCFIKRSRFVVKQEKNTEVVAVSMASPEISNAEELKKYKDLFDSGVITREEFDAKKKQLLGLKQSEDGLSD